MKKIIKFFTSKEDGNLAFHVGDNEKKVKQNHIQLASKYHYELKNLRYMNQVHGNNVSIVTLDSQPCINECDAIITQELDLPLMVMVADCIPILMYDQEQGVIAAIHAGRNSTFLNIASKTASMMIDKFGCKAENIEVELGPSIQKCCYEVSLELSNIVKNSFGEAYVNERYIDLQGINIKQLNEMGVNTIKVSNICTKCSNEPYFSYRKNKKTGRFAGVIMLKSQ